MHHSLQQNNFDGWFELLKMSYRVLNCHSEVDYFITNEYYSCTVEVEKVLTSFTSVKVVVSKEKYKQSTKLKVQKAHFRII